LLITVSSTLYAFPLSSQRDVHVSY